MNPQEHLKEQLDDIWKSWYYDGHITRWERNVKMIDLLTRDWMLVTKSMQDCIDITDIP
jgi:hypothetical protein